MPTGPVDPGRPHSPGHGGAAVIDVVGENAKASLRRAASAHVLHGGGGDRTDGRRSRSKRFGYRRADALRGPDSRRRLPADRRRRRAGTPSTVSIEAVSGSRTGSNVDTPPPMNSVLTPDGALVPVPQKMATRAPRAGRKSRRREQRATTARRTCGGCSVYSRIQ